MFKDKVKEDGRYWEFGSDLTPEEKLERRALYQKPDYLLKIKTDDYAGNYERELVAYALGILSVSCMYDYLNGDPFYQEIFKKYFKKYWKKEGCRDYEEYLQKHPDAASTDKYTHFYKNMLHPTWQCVDDWEEETFYNIYHKDGGRTIIIQIRDAEFAGTEVGKRLLKRIRKFFKKGYACRIAKSYKNPPKLLSLALFDTNEQLVKEFPVG